VPKEFCLASPFPSTSGDVLTAGLARIWWANPRHPVPEPGGIGSFQDGGPASCRDRQSRLREG